MASTSVSINFAQGLNTKTDPWQIPIGQFLSLKNSVFQKGNLLSKRAGYSYQLASPSGTTQYLTTLNDNLLAIGPTISAQASSINQFISKGTLQPCSLSVIPSIRNNFNQTQVDSAVSNGLICLVYSQQHSTASGSVISYLYAVSDAETGQNIVSPSAIPPLSTGTISGSSRVFIVGGFFVIVSPVTVSASVFLQYVSIPIINPTQVSTAQNIYPEVYTPITDNPGWDGAVSSGNTLVIAYNSLAGGQGVHVISLEASQISAHQQSSVLRSFTNAAYKASILTMCVDTTVSPNIFYISFWNSTTTNGYTCSVYTSFGAITVNFNPQQMITSVAVSNLASAAQNNVCRVFSEVTNAYSYDSTIPSNFINGVTVSSAGSVGSPYVVVRSVGLASKAFIVSSQVYFLSAFQSPFQPSYFVIEGSTSTSASPIIVAKLAYQNGGGYLTLGLPSVTVSVTTASMSYLFKQDVQALNTLSNPQLTTQGGIYSQLGANHVSIEIGTDQMSSAEIAQNLHLSGGFLSHFDGFYPIEHNFFLFPDSIKTTYTASSAVTPTGTFSSGSTSVVVSSATGISVGMTITDTSNAYIPAGTTVVYVSGTTLTISAATTHAAAGDNLSIQGNIAAQPDSSTNTNAYYYICIYQWTDMKGNSYVSGTSIPVAVTTSSTGTAGKIQLQGPMLRLTQKIFNVPKITIYRWSVSTQVYNQITTINSPVLNDTTADSWSFVDTQPDANIVGNSLLYTAGGVVQDTNGPACNVMTLFDTRLWLVDAEDRSLLWVSKTVVEGTPVEMSSLFTIFVSANIGTTQATGPVTAIFPLDDKILCFKQNSIFFINGTGPDNLGSTSPGSPLGNYSQPTFVTGVVGCDNPKSLVLTPDGVMFESTDKGIWIIRRNLQTDYIGAPVQIYNTSSVTSATVIPDTNFVLFTLNTGQTLMYDYYYGQWGTWQGMGTVVSSCIHQGRHTILNTNGQILQQVSGTYLDATNPVLMQFTTSWINLASLQGYERFYDFYLLANFLSPHKMAVTTAYDYNDSASHLSTIVPKNYSPVVPGPFGIQTPFGSFPQVEQFRIHAKQQLCQSFQISIQEIFDPSYGTVAGAGFTMSGITAEVLVKRATRPIRGANAVG